MNINIRKYKDGDEKEIEEAIAQLVCAEHLENNPASGKVMLKAGMKYEGKLRSRIIDKNGKRNDLLTYSTTKEEYTNKLQINRF